MLPEGASWMGPFNVQSDKSIMIEGGLFIIDQMRWLYDW